MILEASKEKWWDRFHEGKRLAHSIERDLLYLAACFGVTGNSEMAETLKLIAGDLSEATGLMGNAVIDSLKEQSEDARESLCSTVQLVMSHILGPQEEGQEGQERKGGVR